MRRFKNGLALTAVATAMAFASSGFAQQAAPAASGVKNLKMQ